MKRISYAGEKVSIGIDVHKRHYTVTCMVRGDVVKRATTPADPLVLIEFIGQYFAGAEIRSAYEAGFSGFVLHRALAEAGIKNIVVHAASIEVAARDRVKTDRRDSRKLAELLECGRLRGIRVPTVEEEGRRLLHRTREQLIRKRSQIVNQVRMRLYQFGITLPAAFSRQRVEEQISKHTGLPAEFFLSIESLLVLWDALNAETKKFQKLQFAQAKTDPHQEIYGSLPGFGLQTVRVVSTELGDMQQFSNERALFSFVGLTPTENSTGEAVRRGHISRQGSARLRGVLVEAAWCAVRYDEYWRRVYQRLAARIGGKRAIVAVARKLIGLARALIRKNELYQQPCIKAAA